jgi:integrase
VVDVSRPNNPEPTIPIAIDQFIAAMRIAGRAERTCTLYREALKPLSEQQGAPSEFTTEQCASFLNSKRTPTTRYTTRSVLNTFFRYCVQQLWIECSPTDSLPRERYTRRERRVLTDEQLHQIWEAAGSHRSVRRVVEDRLMLALFMQGLTSGEVLNLRWSDIDLTQGWLHVTNARAGGYRRFVESQPLEARERVEAKRRVSLTPLIVSLLNEYRTERLPTVSTDAVLQMTRQSLRVRVLTIGKKAKVHLTTYMFRHTLVANWVQRFADSDALPTRGRWPIERQQQLDHPSRLLRDEPD